MKFTSSHLTVPCEGELLSGDVVVLRHEQERVLLGVVDVLGHGPNAARVAEQVAEWLQRTEIDQSVEAVVVALHELLRGDRGAAALICSFRAGHVEACSVGNVELRGVSTKLPLLLTPGILGVGRLPRLRMMSAPLSSHTRLVGFTDGVSPRFVEQDLRAGSPDETCRAVMSAHRRKHDDATVVVLDVEEI